MASALKKNSRELLRDITGYKKHEIQVMSEEDLLHLLKQTERCDAEMLRRRAWVVAVLEDRGVIHGVPEFWLTRLRKIDKELLDPMIIVRYGAAQGGKLEEKLSNLSRFSQQAILKNSNIDLVVGDEVASMPIEEIPPSRYPQIFFESRIRDVAEQRRFIAAEKKRKKREKAGPKTVQPVVQSDGLIRAGDSVFTQLAYENAQVVAHGPFLDVDDASSRSESKIIEIQIRVTEKEFKSWTVHAKEAGLSVSELIRRNAHLLGRS